MRSDKFIVANLVATIVCLAWAILFCVTAPVQVSAQNFPTQAPFQIQDTDTLFIFEPPVATFADARSIAVDFSGRLYVVDAARAIIYSFDANGRPIASFGGAGTDEGQFDQPTDVDPTAGLLFNVADAGNSRIQRFSRDFRFVESLPIPSRMGSAGNGAPSFRAGSGRVVTPADGYPIAVASSRADDLFVIEDVSQRVIRWDRDRRNKWVMGQNQTQQSSLQHPVDIVVSGDELFVADRGREALIVYDFFGLYIQSIAEGRLENIVAVGISADILFAVLPSELLLFSVRGRLEHTYRVSLSEDEPLVDATLFNGQLYLLTGRNLYVLPFTVAP